MRCTCGLGLNHWHHAILGLQGIVGMLNVLEKEDDLPINNAALEALEKWTNELAGHVARQKAKRGEATQ